MRSCTAVSGSEVISRSMYSIYKLTASLLLFRSEGSISVQVTMWECPLHGILIIVACPRLSTFIGRILRDDELLKCDRRSPYYRPTPVDNEYFYFCTLSFEAVGGHLNYCLFVRSNRVLPFTYVTSSSEHPHLPVTYMPYLFSDRLLCFFDIIYSLWIHPILSLRVDCQH